MLLVGTDSDEISVQLRGEIGEASRRVANADAVTGAAPTNVALDLAQNQRSGFSRLR